jgi:hypothetical protein
VEIIKEKEFREIQKKHIRKINIMWSECWEKENCFWKKYWKKLKEAYLRLKDIWQVDKIYKKTIKTRWNKLFQFKSWIE